MPMKECGSCHCSIIQARSSNPALAHSTMADIKASHSWRGLTDGRFTAIRRGEALPDPVGVSVSNGSVQVRWRQFLNRARRQISGYLSAPALPAARLERDDVVLNLRR